MSEYIKPSYPKKLREYAKRHGRHLVTIDIPGLTFQGCLDDNQVQRVTRMLTKWFKEKSV